MRSFSAPDYRDLKKGATIFSARRRLSLRHRRPDRPRANRCASPACRRRPAFFDVFDAPPLLGRTYHEATDKPGAAVAVIGEAIWQQQFGGDPAVIGTQVRLNGTPTEIIGVVPERLRHPSKSDVWMLSPIDVPTSPLGLDEQRQRATCITSRAVARDRRAIAR